MNCLEVISRAMRRIGVLASGELPRDVEAGDALDTLSGIYARLITEGAFGEIHSFNASASMTAGENQRIILSDPNTVITLPETVANHYPCDGSFGGDLYGEPCAFAQSNGTRPVRDGAVVIIANHVTNTIQTFIRDGQANIWLDIDNLDLTSPAPLSRRDPTGLACYLAIEIADEYGQQPSAMTTMNAARWQMGITHNWSEASPPTRGYYF